MIKIINIFGCKSIFDWISYRFGTSGFKMGTESDIRRQVQRISVSHWSIVQDYDHNA